MKAVQAMSVFHRGERPERPFPYSLHEGVMGAAGAAGAQEWVRDSASEEAAEKFIELVAQVAQVAQVALLPLSQRFIEIDRSSNFPGRSLRSLSCPARAPWARSLTPRAELCATRAARHTQNEAKELTTACAGSWNNPGGYRGSRSRAWVV
jgi:hypothetical protein